MELVTSTKPPTMRVGGADSLVGAHGPTGGGRESWTVRILPSHSMGGGELLEIEEGV